MHIWQHCYAYQINSKQIERRICKHESFNVKMLKNHALPVDYHMLKSCGFRKKIITVGNTD